MRVRTKPCRFTEAGFRLFFVRFNDIVNITGIKIMKVVY